MVDTFDYYPQNIQAEPEEPILFAQLIGIAFVFLVLIFIFAFIRIMHSRQLKSKHGYHDIYWWTGGYGGGSGFTIGGFGGFGGGFS